jgi:hypothetical protein
MIVVRLTYGFVALCIAVAGSGAAAAERAAGIEYDFVARPAGVPAGYDAAAGTILRFLSIKAIDESKIEAALWQPAGRTADTTTLIISVHGSRGTFHADPIAFLTKGLAAKGYGVLGINTRAGRQVNADNFLDVRRDLEAAAYTARALGYRRLVLHGQALGSIHVQFYAATNWEKDIKAVILTGMFGNLPWKSRHMLVQDEENWRELLATAMQALRDAKDEQVMPVQMAWITGEKVPMSGRHFLTYRSEITSTADGTYWIPAGALSAPYGA